MVLQKNSDLARMRQLFSCLTQHCHYAHIICVYLKGSFVFLVYKCFSALQTGLKETTKETYAILQMLSGTPWDVQYYANYNSLLKHICLFMIPMPIVRQLALQTLLISKLKVYYILFVDINNFNTKNPVLGYSIPFNFCYLHKIGMFKANINKWLNHI